MLSSHNKAWVLDAAAAADAAAASLIVLARLDDVINLEDHLANLQQQTAAAAAAASATFSERDKTQDLVGWSVGWSCHRLRHILAQRNK
jgi:hypothetical protein